MGRVRRNWNSPASFRPHAAVLLAVVSLCLGWADAFGQTTTNYLIWRAAESRVDADIRGWPLDTLLKQVAAKTGWRVFVEPETTHTVSTKFKDLTPGEALRRLLDRLNFAVLPQSNAPAQLLVFRTSMQDATQAIRAAADDADPDTRARPIPNELIVRVKPGTDIEALARTLGAKIIGKLDGMNAYRLQFKDEAATELARRTLGVNSEVTAVDNNYAYDRPPGTRDVLSTSIAPVQLKARPGAEGRVVIGLIDTAVQKLDGSLNDFLLPAVSVAGGAQVSAEAPTHGTAMAETLLRGVQAATTGGSAAKILPVDVYGANGSTTTFDVALGVYKAVNDGGAAILNLSLGSDGDSPFLHQLLQSASKQGVMVFAAAGNTPTTEPTYPAAYPEVIAVTAGERNGQISSYANRGDFVDLVAPGAGIVYFNGQPYYVNGTSAATAFASGLAAGLKDGTRRSPAEVEAALKAMLGAKPFRTP